MHVSVPKMVNVKSFRGDGIEGYDFTKFGEHITLDTMVLHGLTNRGINGETDAHRLLRLWYRLDVMLWPVEESHQCRDVESFS